MPIRLCEIIVAESDVEELLEVMDEVKTLDIWEVGIAGGRAAIRMLIPLEGVEAVTDRVRDRFEGTDGFRLTVQAIEATMPVPGKKGDSDEEEDDDEESNGPLRVSREELYQDLQASIRISPVYLATVALSTVVAAVGILRDDVAVVIGAMVIAPLLGPNVSLALAAALGDPDLALRSLKANVAGVVVALAISLLIGVVAVVDPTTPQLLARTRVGLADLALALAAGSAGSLAYTTGLPTAVIGVMVAVALLPPLVATGVLAGAGYFASALGAGVLLVTNVACVNLAGVATFLAQRVSPRTWWEAKRARKATRIAIGTWITTLAILTGIILWFW